MKETDLYEPVKTFLEGQGYEVKAEIGSCDVMAMRKDEDPVIVELKTGFTLTLLHQGVDRQKVSDWVYLAIPRGKGRGWLKLLKGHRLLCQRLGLGLLTVRMPDGVVEAQLDPAPYQPRKAPTRKNRLLREFARRVGDPNTGGSTRKTIVTAYRQDAMLCAQYLSEHGPSKGAEVAKATGVTKATTMMRTDHYGWFERVDTGIYRLTPKGEASLTP